MMMQTARAASSNTTTTTTAVVVTVLVGEGGGLGVPGVELGGRGGEGEGELGGVVAEVEEDTSVGEGGGHMAEGVGEGW